MANVELSGCSFKYMELAGTDFRQANFFDSSLKGIDFTLCDIGGITVGRDDLWGAVVTVQQAAQLAKLMGVVVV